MRVDIYFSRKGKADALYSATGSEYAALMHTPRGKPYLPGGREISISDSGNAAVVAVSDSPVGVDIEFVRERDISRILRGMNPSDVDRIRSGGLREFYRVWTVHEAAGKLRGTGITLKRLRETESEIPGCFCTSAVIDSEYMLSVCSDYRMQVFFHGHTDLECIQGGEVYGKDIGAG